MVKSFPLKRTTDWILTLSLLSRLLRAVLCLEENKEDEKDEEKQLCRPR